jgi:hypothetical protein
MAIGGGAAAQDLLRLKAWCAFSCAAPFRHQSRFSNRFEIELEIPLAAAQLALGGVVSNATQVGPDTVLDFVSAVVPRLGMDGTTSGKATS